MVKYSKEPAVASKSAKAIQCDVRSSFKNCYNVVQAIRGLKLETAKKYLQQALNRERIIPFNRYKSGVSRKAQCKEFKETTQGRWPEKSIKVVQNLLRNAEANAEFKNLDTDNLVIAHALCNRAQQGRRRTYRAHGRINAYKSSPCHIELIVAEESEDVEKADGGKQVKFTKKQIAKQRLGAAN